LKRTYRYEPLAFTTAATAEELRTALVGCEIRSWLTGSRLVSLPFSDHCDVLTDDVNHLDALLSRLDAECSTRHWKYIELRPAEGAIPGVSGYKITGRFILHRLDVRAEIDVLFGRLHKSTTQRKIRRAEREGVEYREGCSGELLREFYRLLVLTRQRHGLPPQPFAWFHNLAACLGEKMKVRIASYRGQAIAAMVTLRHGATLTYKYGASDAAWHQLGGVHLLFWNAIQDAHDLGCVTLDLGRTDVDDDGLATFKERWGAVGVPLCYWRFETGAPGTTTSARDWLAGFGAQTARRVPARVRTAAGRVLYRHFG
jgi:hypothetical protein